MLELLLLIFIITINLSLGILVLSKDKKNITNIYFMIMTTSFVLWSLVNYISVHPVYFEQIYWVRLVLFFAVMLCMGIFLSLDVFPTARYSSGSKARTIAIISSIFVMILCLTPYVFKYIDTSSGGARPVPGVLIPIFIIEVLALLIIAAINLIKKYRKSTGRLRLQIRFVFYGIGGSLLLILTTNFVLVLLTGNTTYISLGPLFTMIFSSSMAYAIVKHKLFDIKAVVARGFGYILSLITIGFLYWLMLYSIIILIGLQDSIDSSHIGIFITLALLSSIAFSSVKKFFDKATNRYFYRDSYDPQYVINLINSSLVNTLSLNSILTSTSNIIDREFKVKYTSFYLDPNASIDFHIAGSNTKLFTDSNWNVFLDYFQKTQKNIIYLGDDSLDSVVNKSIEDLDIGCAVKMKSNNEVVGYLVVGARKSGNGFSTNDTQLLEIIADEVAIAVQNSLRYEEIARFNITLQQEIDSATRELKNSNEKLLSLDEAKDDFISMASHQMRTPLTSIKGYISMILEGDAGEINEQQKNFLNQAFISSQRMVFLISDLLNVSRLKTGKFTIDKTDVYLPDIVEIEIDQLQSTAEARGLSFDYSPPKEFPKLMLDETKTHQVIMNFIDNAIFYSPKGGKIKIELSSTDKSASIKIIDSGIGVPKSDQHQLFSKFYRADNAKKARPDGTGLGLYMAKKVMIAQGGHIIFESQEGKGSTFGFSFPVQNA